MKIKTIKKDSQHVTHQIPSLEVDLDGGTHRRLDVDLANVLPLLLEKRSEEISSKLGVGEDFRSFHEDVSDSNVEAHDLLHLELDGRLQLVNLALHIVRCSKEGGELSGLGQTRTKKTGDLLDHVVGSQEEIVTLGELLDHLLVLVQLLQVLDGHVVDTDTIGLFAMGSVTENTALEIGTRDGREPESSGETLVTDGIVVLQGNLSLDSLDEVTLLSLHGVATHGDFLTLRKEENIIEGLFQEGRVEFGGHVF
jgi:hypothetical protein